MTQEIITYIILLATACIIAYKLFYPKTGQKKASCGNCESSCSGCELTELKALKHRIEVAQATKKEDGV